MPDWAGRWLQIVGDRMTESQPQLDEFSVGKPPGGICQSCGHPLLITPGIRTACPECGHRAGAPLRPQLKAVLGTAGLARLRRSLLACIAASGYLPAALILEFSADAVLALFGRSGGTSLLPTTLVGLLAFASACSLWCIGSMSTLVSLKAYLTDLEMMAGRAAAACTVLYIAIASVELVPRPLSAPWSLLHGVTFGAIGIAAYAGWFIVARGVWQGLTRSPGADGMNATIGTLSLAAIAFWLVFPLARAATAMNGMSPQFVLLPQTIAVGMIMLCAAMYIAWLVALLARSCQLAPKTDPPPST